MMNVVIDPDKNDYRVDLAVFHGPLDLLLYLIKKEEVDIYDIPIARITRQYLRYIELMTSLNLEVAGEFILMAATLIRIKTRLLLPRDENDTEEPDLRDELIMALVEYRKFKEAGEILREKALIEEQNYVPPSPVGTVENYIDEIPDVQLWDLISAFNDALKARRDELVHEVVPEDVSVEERMTVILKSLRSAEYATFLQLFADVPRRIVAVVTFIALLELARNRRITIMQSMPFAQMRVYRGERFDAPRDGADLIDIDNPQEVTVG
ncbi:MAG TPA: segregation/condensation protein A [candidate division Zixibacteria bacterium]|nr:segregation/condensation protein A [candidate division Zixibacteria bacterium]